MLIENLVNKYHDEFTDSEQVIVEYLIGHRYNIVALTLPKIAQETHTSNATIIRLFKKMGFSGFSEFKFSAKKSYEIDEFKTMDSMNVLYSDIEATTSIIQQTKFSLIFSEMQKAKRIFVYGTGWGEQKAVENLARNFLSVNILLTIIPSVSELKWLDQNVQPDSLLIVASYSGDNEELNDIVRILKMKKYTIVALTRLLTNTLASIADYNLYYQTTPLFLTDDSKQEINSYLTLDLAMETWFRKYLDYQNKKEQ